MHFNELPTDKQEYYGDCLDDASKQHPLVYDDNGTLRFQRNPAVRWCVDHINLNDLWRVAASEGWPSESLRELYRLMGYSVDGFLDIFPPPDEAEEREEELTEVIRECIRQIEYLHEKFQPTGTGEAVLARAREAIGE